MAELPGNVHEKIGDLRIEKGLTKKQVSEDLGIPASQLTRIENEDIKSIGHELVIKFADYLSINYILPECNYLTCMYLLLIGTENCILKIEFMRR